jgi:hypothetical protein
MKPCIGYAALIAMMFGLFAVGAAAAEGDADDYADLRHYAGVIAAIRKTLRSFLVPEAI